MATYIFNAILRLHHIPECWKTAKIIMIVKDGKPLEESSSYRPISQLPAGSKLFEKLFLARLNPVMETSNLIPDFQFGFRSKHSTIEQVPRVASVIDEALEQRKFCLAIFLHVAQAFDRVWHDGLRHKLKNILPGSYCAVISSYLSNRKFVVAYNSMISNTGKISAGVFQGSPMTPILYVLYTADILVYPHSTIALFADDTVVLSSHQDYATSVIQLQAATNLLTARANRWKIGTNHSKSVRVDFTLRPHQSLPVRVNNEIVP